MNLSEYQQQAARTLLDEMPCKYSSFEIGLVWNVLGLVGEAGEFLEKHMYQESTTKELGDCLWYIAALCTKANIPMERLAAHKAVVVNLQNTDLSLAVSALAEYIKKAVFHEHGFNLDDFEQKLRAVYVIWREYVSGEEMAQVMEMNINKLKQRYPDGWDVEDSKHGGSDD